MYVVENLEHNTTNFIRSTLFINVIIKLKINKNYLNVLSLSIARKNHFGRVQIINHPKCLKNKVRFDLFQHDGTDKIFMEPLVQLIELNLRQHPKFYSRVNTRTMHILQRAPILRPNSYLNVHNIHLKLASPILGWITQTFTASLI